MVFYSDVICTSVFVILRLASYISVTITLLQWSYWILLLINCSFRSNHDNRSGFCKTCSHLDDHNFGKKIVIFTTKINEKVIDLQVVSLQIRALQVLLRLSSYILKRPQILRNLHLRFVLWSSGHIYVGDFAKFCGLLRIYELCLCWEKIMTQRLMILLIAFNLN